MDQKELATQIRPFGIVLTLLIILIIFSTLFFHEVEKWNYIDSYYFTIVTVATVGYGDFTPKTDLGKIGATFLILFGIGIFSTFVTLLLKRRALKTIENREKRQDKNKKSNLL